MSDDGWQCVRGNSRNTASVSCPPLRGRVLWESERIGFADGDWTSTPIFRGASDLFVAINASVKPPFGAVVLLDRSSGRRTGNFTARERDNPKEWNYDPAKTGAYAPVLDTEGAAFFPCNNDVIYAQSNRLNKALWEYRLPTQSGNTYSGVLDDENNLYFGKEINAVFSLDKTTGKLRWQTRSVSPFRCPPAVDKQTLFIGSRGGMLYALNTKTGVPRWKRQLPGMLDYTSPTVWKDRVVIGMRKDAGVMALRADDGSVCWQTPLPMPDYEFTFVQSGAVDDSGLYVVACDASLYALNMASGRVRWSRQCDETKRAKDAEPLIAPVIGGNVVYTGDSKNLYALHVRSGHILWKLPIGITNAPSLSAQGVLYAPTNKGTVVAIG